MDDPLETGVPESGHEERRPRRRLARRLLVGFLATVALLALVAGVLYLFGGMERPGPEVRAAYDGLVSEGKAAPAAGRFTIPIPGCRCHSDDPVLTIEHSTRRISECSGCHGSGGR